MSTETKQKIESNRTLVVIGGLGAVASCALPLIDREFSFTKIVALDAKEQTSTTKKKWPLPNGAEFHVEIFTEDNYEQILDKYLAMGDICCNLSVIESRAILIWCMQNDVLYLDTSGESWAECDDAANLDTRTNFRDASLSRLHRKLANSLTDLYEQNPDKKKWPTCVVQHGMNPGLVNQFIKQGLQDIATELLTRKEGCRERCNIQHYLEQRNWAHLSQALGVQTIHISERDTQRSTRPRNPGEFHSTWSVEGFAVELRDYAEIGLGTFERRIPREAHVFGGKDDTSAILGGKAANMRVMSWVPSGDIQGFPCPHDESITMAKFLSIHDSKDSSLVYRPTIMFAYMPCDASLASIHEFAMNGYKDPTTPVLLNDSIVAGKDEVGVLLMGHELGAWWTGSCLCIDNARSILPGHNATTMQVAAGVVGALTWMIQNPREGFKFPEHIPHEEVIAAAKPYLEPFVSIQSNWSPLKKRTQLSMYDYIDRFGPLENGANAACIPKKDNEWQLATMLLQPAGNSWVKSPTYVQSNRSSIYPISAPLKMGQAITQTPSAPALLQPWKKNALQRLPFTDVRHDNKFDATLYQVVPDGIRIGRTAYGFGLFANNSFKRGEVIYQGHGITIAHNLNAHFKLLTNQGDSYDINAETHSCHKGNADERWLYGFDGFFNHSCIPNTFSAACEEDEFNTIYLTVASKDIEAGEELTVDYNLFEWDCKNKGIDICLCGSPGCQGSVHGYKYLSPNAQQEKLGQVSCKHLLQEWLKENPKTIYHMITDLPSGLRISQSFIDGQCGLQATKDFKVGETIFENQAIFIPQAPLDRASERDKLIVSYPDPIWERLALSANSKMTWLVKNAVLSTNEGQHYFTLPPLTTKVCDWHYHTEIGVRTPESWMHEFFSFDTFCNHGCSPSAEMVYDDDENAPVICVPSRNGPHICTLLTNGKVVYDGCEYEDLVSVPDKATSGNITLVGPEASHVKRTQRYCMVACQNLRVGQEITCDYSELRGQETGYVIEECKCGSKKCRGTVVC